ncbi:MAG TPA: serine protein kinase RIO [archaeon]|nr:serine protein kinase RIO [archaeon]
MEPDDYFDDEDFEILKRRIKDDRDRRIFQQVFDSKTLDAIQSLAQKGLFEIVEHVLSTGKEAHVFIATDAGGKKRAVKIFMMETTLFGKMNQYIVGDRRFENLRKDKRNLVIAWTKKEYKNLMIANEARLPVPMPLGFRENVLVMEFIGEGEHAAPRLKDIVPSRAELSEYKEQIIDFMARLYLAGLVHADLSEYNILVKEGKLYVIDFGQALLLTHPKAKEFFERDVKNLANYFTRAGLETEYSELYAAVKAKKDALDKKKKAKK